mmetsp:Transcript_32397/g.59237  ORF Transcript_32397/g.59237 Transcript_32397/m.59237 type:complete len:264 (+) Transcript_32397:26-817(+)
MANNLATEKEWKVADPQPMGPMAWVCDIVRVEDGHVVKRVTITPVTLPPRFGKGKKVAWQLPTDGSVPKLGVYEQERVIGLFKEMRKKGKKEKKLKEEEILVKAKPAELLQRACRAWLWRRRRVRWLNEARKPIRYSLSELLRLRYASPRPPPSTVSPFISTPSFAPSPPGFQHKMHSSPPGLSPSVAVNILAPSHLQRAEGRTFGAGGSDGRNLAGMGTPHKDDESEDEEEKARWKLEWKSAYLARLEVLAETAWQKHKTGS